MELVLLALTALVVICWVLASNKNSENWGLIGAILTGCLVVGLIFWPVKHYEIKSEIAQFKMTTDTIEVMRFEEDDGGVRGEVFAVNQPIIDANKWLASQKYWNGTIFDMYIPDEVDSLKYLK